MRKIITELPFALIFLGIVLLGLLGSIFMLGQAFEFLSTGTWTPYSAVDLFGGLAEAQNIRELRNWSETPENLIGLHKILSFLNGRFTLFLLSYVFIIAFLYFFIRPKYIPRK